MLNTTSWMNQGIRDVPTSPSLRTCSHVSLHKYLQQLEGSQLGGSAPQWDNCSIYIYVYIYIYIIHIYIYIFIYDYTYHIISWHRDSPVWPQHAAALIGRWEARQGMLWWIGLGCSGAWNEEVSIPFDTCFLDLHYMMCFMYYHRCYSYTWTESSTYMIHNCVFRCIYIYIHIRIQLCVYIYIYIYM